ncbi:MAG: hypothetical protein ABSE72_07245 [Bacteroidales bacterium]|jgi:hypothetical protein
MEWTTQQFKDIEDLASINYSLEQIAMYLDVEKNSFIESFNIPGSKVKYHYDRGKLITQAEISKANLRKAKDGSLASIQQWTKDAFFQKIETLKKQVLYDNEQKEYCQLQALIERGETENLPENVVKYYEQIDFIRALYNKFKSKNYIISMVRLQWPKITLWQANKLFNETLNFFNLDNEVKVEAWANIYADQLDNMAMIAAEMNDFKNFRDLKELAGKYRGIGKEKPIEIPEGDLKRKVNLYVIDPERLGITKIDRRELAEMIDAIDITESQKMKIRRDALIEDVSFELIESER